MIDPRMRALEALMGGQPIGQGSLAPLAPVSLPQALPEAEGIATTFAQSGPSEYDALLEQARKAGLGVDFMRAGGMINEALTGAKAPMDLYAGLEARAQQPLQNLERRRKAALEDPFSPETIRRRAALERANPELAKSLGAGDDTSWGDIEAIQGIVPAPPRAGATPKSTDPKSPESQLAQARVRSLLGGQLTEEDIANVTEASEADVMKYGTLGRGHEIIREGHLATKQRSDADRTQSATQFAQSMGLKWAELSSEQKMRMKEFTDRQAEREAARAERKEEKTAKDVQGFGKEVVDSGAPGFYQRFDEAQGIMSNYKDDLPGLGRIDGRKPDEALTPDGRQLRMLVGQLLSDYRKGQTGAGMTEGERTEYGQITGLIYSGNDDAVRQGMALLGRALDARVKATAASFRPEAVEEYGKRNPRIGGVVKPKAAAPPPSATSEPRIINTKGMKPGDLVKSLQEGETVRVPMGGGKYQTVRRKNGKLIRVKE